MRQRLMIASLLYGGLATAQGVAVNATTVSAEEQAALAAALAGDLSSGPPAAVSAPLSGIGTGDSNPNISLVLDTAAAWFSEPEPRQTGGHDPNATGFGIQQVELHLDASVDPFFRYDANLVFSPFGVEVEEAYATTLALPANLQMRAGLFLTRFGRINPTHPHSWDFLDQPLVNGKFFGGDGSRGEGVEVSWLTPLPWFAEVIVSSNTAQGGATARSFLGGSPRAVEEAGDLLYTTALQQFFPINSDWSLKWGLSGQFGPNAEGRDTRTELYGTDLYLRYRPIDSTDRTTLTLTVEAMYRTRQVPDDRLEDYGGYAALVWGLDAEWQLGLRQEWVTGVDDDPLDPEWTDARDRTTAQISYFPSHFSRIRLQASRDEHHASADAHDDHDHAVADEPIWAVMLGLEVVIGAHGAHSF